LARCTAHCRGTTSRSRTPTRGSNRRSASSAERLGRFGHRGGRGVGSRDRAAARRAESIRHSVRSASTGSDVSRSAALPAACIAPSITPDRPPPRRSRPTTMSIAPSVVGLRPASTSAALRRTCSSQPSGRSASVPSQLSGIALEVATTSSDGSSKISWWSGHSAWARGNIWFATSLSVMNGSQTPAWCASTRNWSSGRSRSVVKACAAGSHRP
jgi:hypothetical protein